MRIPRDTFGEGLLELEGSRACTAARSGTASSASARARSTRERAPGSRADPWHGGRDDPRRVDAGRAPLVVEEAGGGPYVVCRNDPVGRADPTGAVSVPLVLSTLTHASANNLLGFFGLDLTVNFWGCVFTGQFERFFSMEGLSSTDRMGSFGIRRDGWISYGHRAWTFQHEVWSSAEHIDELLDVRVFDPQGVFEPDLYGTLLLITPGSGGQAFVLRGSGNANADVPLARAGGRASGGVGAAAIPGSPVPRFTAGGLHFDRFEPHVRDATGKLTVLRPTGAIHQGTLEVGTTVTLTVPHIGAPDVDDRLVLITDEAVRIAVVKQRGPRRGNRERLVLELEGAGLPAPSEEATLRGIGDPGASQSMSVGTNNFRPTAPAGTSADDFKDSVLRLSQGGAVVGLVKVGGTQGNEIVLDRRLPGTPANPYDVERMKLGSPDIQDLSVRVPATVKLAGAPPPNVAGVALELQRLSTATVAAGTPLLAAARLTGAVLSVTLPATPPRAPTPSQVVLLRDTGGAALEPALVKKVRVTVTLDRTVSPAGTKVEIVGLRPAGRSTGACRGTPRPWRSGPRSTLEAAACARSCRASASASSSRCRGRARRPTGSTASRPSRARRSRWRATLRCLRRRPRSASGGSVPEDPQTGGARLGVGGRAGSTPTAFTFDVWQPDAFAVGDPVAIDDGNVSHPARVSALGDVEVELHAAPTTVGRAAGGAPAPTVDVLGPGLATVKHAATFTQAADVLTLNDLVPPLDTSANVTFVVPFESTGTTRDGALSSGGVLIPEALEIELERRASLVEHELRHTHQCLTWGPWLLGWWPLNVMEGLVEAGSDVELPEWSPYASVNLVSEDGARWLTVPAGFEQDDTIQISFAGPPQTLKLGDARADGRRRVNAEPRIPDGPVSVRKELSTTANDVWATTFDILELFTHGGLLNLLVGATWGSLFFLIAHGFHALGRAFSASGGHLPVDGRVGRRRAHASATPPAARRSSARRRSLS